MLANCTLSLVRGMVILSPFRWTNRCGMLSFAIFVIPSMLAPAIWRSILSRLEGRITLGEIFLFRIWGVEFIAAWQGVVSLSQTSFLRYVLVMRASMLFYLGMSKCGHRPDIKGAGFCLSKASLTRTLQKTAIVHLSLLSWQCCCLFQRKNIFLTLSRMPSIPWSPCFFPLEHGCFVPVNRLKMSSKVLFWIPFILPILLFSKTIIIW